MRQLSDKKIIDILRCPLCGAAMQTKGNSLLCLGQRTHCYDVASSGYVNFCSPDKSGGGDSKQAVRARSEFLNLGYYENVARALAEECERCLPQGGVLIDAGCGEGYYASFLADKGFSVFGTDLSKFAVDAASKRLARGESDNFFFATASVFEMPVADSSADVITNVFAPCAEKEFSRVLKKDGILAIAFAGERHLWGLKNAIYDTANINTERADLPKSMTHLGDRRITYTVNIEGNAQIMSLFAMTPYYWRTSQADMEKLNALDRLTTEVDIIISLYRNDIKGEL